MINFKFSFPSKLALNDFVVGVVLLYVPYALFILLAMRKPTLVYWDK